jgi:hypothetical protein
VNEFNSDSAPDSRGRLLGSRLKSAALLGWAAGVLLLAVAACTEHPTEPPREATTPDFSFTNLEITTPIFLASDSGYVRDSLIATRTMIFPLDSFYIEDVFDIGEASGPVLVEVVSNVSISNRAIYATEMVTGRWFNYRSDGQYFNRPGNTLSLELFDSAGTRFTMVHPAIQLDTAFGTWPTRFGVPAFPTGASDSIVGVDVDAPNHRMQLFWLGRPYFTPHEELANYNALTDSVVPPCPHVIATEGGGSCWGYPVPPFDSTYIDTDIAADPTGTATIRYYAVSAVGEDSASVSLTADTTELHPWVPFISDINGFEQTQRLGDSTALSISVTEEVDVTIRAEFLDGSGGHSHIGSPVSFDDIGVAVDRGAFIQMGSILGQPLAGFFAMEGDSAASFDGITVDGQVSLTFTAGTVGGLVDIIVETIVGATPHADTVTITIKVPDLIHADTSDVVNSVYFVGGVPNPVQGGPDVHVQASNWYMTQDVAGRVEAIASRYRTEHALLVGGGPKYMQHNDASLTFGGTFSVTGLTGELGDHPTNHQHYSHQLGLDVDFNWCMVTSVGDDDQAHRVYGTTCPDSTDYVQLEILQRLANAEGACAKVHNGNHFHIRFTGSCSDA